jgi:nitrate reductase gamma subunit
VVSYFIWRILPYVAVAIFLWGIVSKLRRWLAVPSPFPLTAFPVPGSAPGRVLAFLKEMLFFNSLYRHNRLLWLLSWSMHLSLGLIIFGHILGIYYFGQQFTLVGMSKEGSKALSHFLGIAAGVVFIVSLFVLTARRFYDTEARATSNLANYLELGLLLGIGLTGMGLRGTMTGPEFFLIRKYVAGLIMLHPAAMPVSPWFFWHFFFVNILLMYLPYSKLAHWLGGGIMRIMLMEVPPVYPTATDKPPRSCFAGIAGHNRFPPSGSNISMR